MKKIKILLIFTSLFGIGIFFHLFYDPFLHLFDSNSLRVAKNDILTLSDFSYDYNEKNGMFPETISELFHSLTDEKRSLILGDIKRYVYIVSSAEIEGGSDVIIAEEPGNYAFKKGGYVSLGKYKIEWFDEDELRGLLNSRRE